MLNKEIIDINQDALNIQAERLVHNAVWQVFVKPLENRDVAVGILNTSDKEQTADFPLHQLKIFGKTKARDVWAKQNFRVQDKISVKVASHETKVFRLSK